MEFGRADHHHARFVDIRYFASRPELFGGAGAGAGAATGTEKDLVHNASAALASRATASAIHNAFSNSNSSQDRDAGEPPVARWKKPSNSNSPVSPSPSCLRYENGD